MTHDSSNEEPMDTAFLSHNPAEKTWECPTCGVVPPFALSGWYARRSCACQQRAEEQRQQRQRPRTLEHALRVGLRGQTYGWLGQAWAETGLQEKTFATFERERQPVAFDLAQRFAMVPQGVLALCGSYGLGKTHLLAAIANTLRQADRPCLFASAVSLFNAIGERISRDQDYYDLLGRAMTTPVLLLDDLDKPKPSEFRQEICYQIIDARSKAGRPLALSCNGSLVDLTRWIGGAAQSRLMIGLTPVSMTGSDYRLLLP